MLFQGSEVHGPLLREEGNRGIGQFEVLTCELNQLVAVSD